MAVLLGREARTGSAIPRIAHEPLVVDTAIALGLSFVSLFAVVGGARDAGAGNPLATAMLLLQTLPLIWRRRWPLGVWAVTLVATAGHVVTADPGSVRTSMGVLFALFTVAEREDRRASMAAALLTGAVLGALLIARTFPVIALQGLLQSEIGVVVAWTLGRWSQLRGLYTAALETGREEHARRVLAEERERIAREMHDVVMHDVSVMVIQARGGLRALDRRPDDARAALRAIDDLGRQAMVEMRRLLGVLGDHELGRAPLPRLDQLGALLEQVRAAGLPVELSVEGERRALDPGVELSAYRIVQEALTNSLKHGRGARARVRLAYTPDALEVDVVDEVGDRSAPAMEPAHEGRGLVGMRERATLLGGELSAGPTATGFSVAARLPLGGSAA